MTRPISKPQKRQSASTGQLLRLYILSDPYFQLTLEPYECPKIAPEVVRRMIKAGNTMGIGPMSAVAGTISALAVEAMVEAGAKYAIVDNGGDIALINDRPVVVGIYAGQSPIKNLGLIFEPQGLDYRRMHLGRNSWPFNQLRDGGCCSCFLG